jgi:serine O-acetyltransferase
MLVADRARLREWFADEATLHPAYLCVALYRTSHYFHRRGRKYIARLLWQINAYLTGSDIPAPVQIGPGLLIPCPAGAAVMAKVGRNFTLFAGAGVGSELGRYEDIGAGPGLPVIGDDVVMEPRSGILGPIRIGNRARICAGVTVTSDLPDDGWAVGPPARFMKMPNPK